MNRISSDTSEARFSDLFRIPAGSFQRAFRLRQNHLPDLPFLTTVILLSVIGTITVFSAGMAYAAFRYDDPSFFIRKQMAWVILGFAVMWFSSRLHPKTVYALSGILYLATAVLLLLVLAVGFVGNGAQRWISLGPITIQPSEIGKMTLVLMLARYYAVFEKRAQDKTDRRNIFFFGTLFPGMLLAVFVLLVMLQKHLSCIIILGLIGLLVMLASGIRGRYIAMFSALAAAGVTALAVFTDYTKERITVWRNPEAYRLTGGWQTLQGLMAIGSGGLFGRGIGNSILKHCYISEPANDMIFTVLCEECGFVGAVVVLLLFAFLVWRGYRIALSAPTVFERLSVFGIITKVALQTLLNVAVVTNTIPNTGISLPFFSYGGSSLIMLLFEMGYVLSVSRRSGMLP